MRLRRRLLRRGGPHHSAQGTLSPLIPLSLRAIKGEGERRIGHAHVLKHMRMPLIRYRVKKNRGMRFGMTRGRSLGV